MKKCKLLLFDLDGTLLQSDKTISTRTLSALKKCRGNDILLGVSTSRSEQNSLVFLNELILLKYRIEKAGYTVKDIQKILQLSCPQPIYRWFKGMILPSVDHLYVLSRLLKVHMEDLLVPQCESIREVEMCVCISSYKRLSEYWKRLYINKCA